MRSYKTILSAILILAISFTATAQEKTDSFKVSGNCGMCKNKIEKAAKSAGASYAVWDEDTKVLEVKYESTSTNAAKIQQKIADTGYDNVGFTASKEAYDKLHGCCKYERDDATASASCCEGKTCSKEECKTCCADGKCTSDMDCCKDGKCKMDKKSKSKTAKKA
jgi:hypothetical protein